MRMGECDTVLDQTIDGWGLHVRIAQRADSIETLLISADPEEIGAFIQNFWTF